jgi:hypothetical protein
MMVAYSRVKNIMGSYDAQKKRAEVERKARRKGRG